MANNKNDSGGGGGGNRGEIGGSTTMVVTNPAPPPVGAAALNNTRRRKDKDNENNGNGDDDENDNNDNNKISRLIDELKCACRRPLFQQIRDFEEQKKKKTRTKLKSIVSSRGRHDHRRRLLRNNRNKKIRRQQEEERTDGRKTIDRTDSSVSDQQQQQQQQTTEPLSTSSVAAATAVGPRKNVGVGNSKNNNNNNKRRRSDEGSSSISRQDSNNEGSDVHDDQTGDEDDNFEDRYGDDGVDAAAAADDDDDSSDNDGPRTWEMIVADITTLVPSMTEMEYGQVSKLVAILFLGFLLPHSTGNEYFMLQNLSSAKAQKEQQQATNHPTAIDDTPTIKAKEDMGDYILSMSLEERLESSPSRYDAGGFGELDETIIFEKVENAFQAFLQDGLRPFLRVRPAHKSQVDLLHIIAMAIHPNPSEQSIRETVVKLEQNESESWGRTKKFMRSLVPHSFQIRYRHRLQLVQMVTNDLFLPKIQQDDGLLASRLFEGALPHLRVSLSAFGMVSMTTADSHLAQCGLVSLSVQSRVESAIREEWRRLLHRLVDDQTTYQSVGSSPSIAGENIYYPAAQLSEPSLSTTVQTKEGIDLHDERGKLLNQLLMRVCESRNCANNDFLQYALSSISDAIEMQVDRWTFDDQGNSEVPQDDGTDAKMGDTEKRNLATSQPPGTLAALLLVARTLFCLLPPLPDSKNGEDDDDENESEEGHRRDMLISCGIQLIHHWDQNIVKQACSMLALAFCYNEELWDDYVGAVFASISLAIQSARSRNGTLEAIEGLVATLSQRSSLFAEDVLQLLLPNEMSKEENSVPSFKLVAAIATSCPSAALSKRQHIVNALETCKVTEEKKQILAALLVCRKAVFFESGKGIKEAKEAVHDNPLAQSDSYDLARHALQVGHPEIAKRIFSKLMNIASSQNSFLWFTALEQIASGEALLATDATLALVTAATSMKNAKSSFQNILTNLSLRKMAGQPFSATFQMRWLELRVSHLDLLRVVRQLSQEMRLTGVGPKKNTRPHIHLVNAVKFLQVLSQKYRSFNKKYGIFICQQSRSALRTLQGHCLFVSRVAKTIFFESFPTSTTGDQADTSQEVTVVGDRSQPLTLFAEQFQKVILKKIDSSVGGKVRAAAMLQILDGIVKVPFPIPRALTVAKVIPNADFHAFWDPSEHSDLHDSTVQDVVDIPLGSAVKFSVSGSLPPGLVSSATVPFNVILLWLNVIPIMESGNEGNVSGRIASSPSDSTVVSSSGCFFASVESDILMKEGPMKVSIFLGCRDIHGGVWELPTKSDGQHFLINVVNHN